jgi:hypothetical protein
MNYNKEAEGYTPLLDEDQGAAASGCSHCGAEPIRRDRKTRIPRREIAYIFVIFCQAVALLTIGLTRSKVSEFAIYCESMAQNDFHRIDSTTIF